MVRSRSFEQSETEINFLGQSAPLSVDSRQHSSSIKNLTRCFENESSSPNQRSPTRRSNYSFERYQQSLGAQDSAHCYMPLGVIKNEMYQHPQSKHHRSYTEFTEQEFVFRPSIRQNQSPTRRVDKFGNQLPVWSKPESDEENSEAIVEEPPTPNFRSRFETKTKDLELVRRLPPVLRKKEGQIVKLEFELSGEPPQVSWYKNGILVRNSPDTRILSNCFGLQSLIIPEVFSEDSGLYRAVVELPGGAGSFESYCQLIIEGVYLSQSIYVYQSLLNYFSCYPRLYLISVIFCFSLAFSKLSL